MRRFARQVRMAGLGVLASTFVVSSVALAGPPSTTGTEVSAERKRGEVDVLITELRRNLDSLTLDDAPKPYEASVQIVRAQALTLDGSYGGLITDLTERQAFARLDLRVGSASEDASNFFGSGIQAMFNLPLQAQGNAPAGARALWRMADAAYRESVSTFRAKQAAIRQLAEVDEAPDRAPAPAMHVALPWAEAGQLIDAPAREGIDAQVDHPGLSAAVAELSARFSQHPDIDNGDVFLQVVHHDLTRLDASGAASGSSQTRAYLAVVADTRAEDGMHLDHGAVIHLQSVPTPEMVRTQGAAMVDQVLRELEQMRQAPMLEEDYDGPVLFSSTAAAQVLASTVAVHATGAPAPLSEWGRVVELEPHWLERLGRPVLPAWLGLVDEPQAPGFGHYARDAEGVPAQRVQLVKRGVLGDLLMTRRPNEKIRESNGHARTAFDLAPAATISNLRLESSRRGMSEARLQSELLKRAREDGYDYAYVVESLRDGGVLGSPPRDTAGMFGGGRKVGLPLPAKIFRVDADGTRTLVRGAVFSPVAMRALRRIRELGKSTAKVAMRIAPGIVGGWAVDLGAEGLLTQTVDVQVETPAILVDGFELVVERGEHERLPFLPHPLRVGQGETASAGESDATTQP